LHQDYATINFDDYQQIISLENDDFGVIKANTDNDTMNLYTKNGCIKKSTNDKNKKTKREKDNLENKFILKWTKRYNWDEINKIAQDLVINFNNIDIKTENIHQQVDKNHSCKYGKAKYKLINDKYMLKKKIIEQNES